MNKKGGPLNLVFLSNQPQCGPWTRETQDIQAWITALQGDAYNYLRLSLLHGIKDYDIIIIELTSQVFRRVKRIKKRFPQKILIGALEGSLHSLDNDFSPKNRLRFIETYRELDALGVLIEDSIPYFKLITDKPVFWLGVPFPLEWCQPYIIPPEKKEPIIEMHNTFSSGKGGLTNSFVLKGIQKIHPEVKGRSYSHKKRLDILSAKQFGLNLEILPCVDWQKYFIRHCQAYIALHLDYRWTWNRYSIDCAAAGIPCISTPHSTAHKILFPKLCAEPYDVNKAIQLAIRLLEDHNFYKECREYALEKIKLFNYENSAKRFKEFLITQKWI